MRNNAFIQNKSTYIVLMQRHTLNKKRRSVVSLLAFVFLFAVSLDFVSHLEFDQHVDDIECHFCDIKKIASADAEISPDIASWQKDKLTELKRSHISVKFHNYSSRAPPRYLNVV